MKIRIGDWEVGGWLAWLLWMVAIPVFFILGIINIQILMFVWFVVMLVVNVLAGSPILIFLFAALVYLLYRLWQARR
ncbi:MAG: hypothetical protein NZO41_03645 [Candidatus Bipolaricaulota bacterium]|nr:hypothetical protein [Candidatus Bipolaricaulota bacterium]MDW8141450.1 hypothetical protein [Candidatus Bipolaricaulota bacterium]